MCWWGDLSNKHKAEKDITVIKILKKKDNQLYSPCYNMLYNYNDLAVSEVHVEQKGDFCPIVIIDKGIHCYNPNCEFLIVQNEKMRTGISVKHLEPERHVGVYCNADYIDDNDYKHVAVKCTIPRGTIYWENYLGEIVTNRLIIGEVVFYNSSKDGYNAQSKIF
jgi:hypothetical protein